MTDELWMVGATELDPDAIGRDVTFIGPDYGNGRMFSPEDTIAEFWSGNHNGKANARSVVEDHNRGLGERAVIDAALALNLATRDGSIFDGITALSNLLTVAGEYTSKQS